jgi:hypothetical protein
MHLLLLLFLFLIPFAVTAQPKVFYQKGQLVESPLVVQHGFRDGRKTEIPLPKGRWSVRYVGETKSTQGDQGVNLWLAESGSGKVSQFLSFQLYETHAKNWQVGTSCDFLLSSPRGSALSGGCFGLSSGTIMSNPTNAIQAVVREDFSRESVTIEKEALWLKGMADRRDGLAVYFNYGAPFLDSTKSHQQDFLARVRSGSTLPFMEAQLANWFRAYGQSIVDSVVDISTRSQASVLMRSVPELVSAATQPNTQLVQAQTINTQPAKIHLQTDNASNLARRLPDCQGKDESRWTNCFGTATYTKDKKYGGEFKDGDESQYVGEWKDGNFNGQGIEYRANGYMGRSGIWSSGKYIQWVALDRNSFPYNPSNLIATSNPPSSVEIDRISADVEAERKKRQDLEQQLASSRDRERITAELDLERKKRQELEAQLAASVQPASSQTNVQRRTAHALVIGNGAYPGSGRLDNPVNDANAISQKLRSMGFIVTTVTDANRQKLVQSMAQFRRTAASADISLLYYAGHGVQIFGTNYILPTDVDQTDPAQATIQGVALNSVVENFLPGKTKLVFLDACRDNALQRTSDRSVSKGLAPISVAEGTLISYATKDGQTAADGVGKNSPFTQALLEHINDPQDIAVVLRKVRERVMKITGGKQQPWEYGSLTGGELVLSAIKPK